MRESFSWNYPISENFQYNREANKASPNLSKTSKQENSETDFPFSLQIQLELAFYEDLVDFLEGKKDNSYDPRRNPIYIGICQSITRKYQLADKKYTPIRKTSKK
jgi:hypothetical protein